MKRNQFEGRARIIKALSHSSRLVIVDELAKGKKCVTDLQNAVGSQISTVSRHLSVLKNAGIIEDERRGREILYSLKCKCVVSFFQCAEAVLRSSEPAGATEA